MPGIGFAPIRSPGGSTSGGGPYGADEEIATLWVGNAAAGTSDEDLRSAFSEFGELVTCFLLPKPSPNGQLAGFVRFTTRAEAESALQVVNHGHIEINGAVVIAKWADRNSKPLGAAAAEPKPVKKTEPDSADLQEKLQRISAMISQSPARATPATPATWQRPAAAPQAGEELATLWVGDVEVGTTDQELAEAFEPYGELLAAFLIQKPSPNGQLSGFVRYASQEEAAGALQATEAGDVLLRTGGVKARWATRNTGITKGLGDGKVPTPSVVVPAITHASPPDAALFEAVCDAEAESLRRQNEGMRPAGRNVWSRPSAPTPAPLEGEEITTLWIGNVEVGTTEEELHTAFMQFGELQACFLLPKPSPNGQLSGFVRYPSADEAQAALVSIDAGLIGFRGTKIAGKWANRNTKVSKPSFKDALV